MTACFITGRERAVRHELITLNADEPTLDQKVEFLGWHGAYSHPVGEVIRRETHMSWVFLAGNTVYKLKKPVRFPYLDFSTLARREAACRAELSLNRRLAPDVYLGVVPLIALFLRRIAFSRIKGIEIVAFATRMVNVGSPGD